jgi:phosphoesterase RecJ-like protein
MDPNTIDQIINLIDKSKNVLLLTHARADCDGLGAMLSAYLVLKNLGKEVTAVTNDPAPENLAFLPSVNIIQNALIASKDFIITLDITKTPLSKIKYNLEDNRVNIIITPKNGSFSKEDVTFGQGGLKYDLIISFDAGSFEHLGPIYDQNSELFFEAPIINIDHHASNTDFGQINMVDVVAASTTEVLFRILEALEKKYNKKLITEEIATLLLAGIITDTGSFQHANTSPRSMEVSAKLLDLGARQQDIIKNIYKTKKLSTLKLWGMVLSKVQVDALYRMVWSTITKEDLLEAGAASEETGDIIDDLLSNAPGAEVIMLIKYHEEGYVSVSMRSTTNAVDVGKISSEMGGGGHVRAAGYKVRDGKSFEQVTSEILDKVRKYQTDRLNIQIQVEPQSTPQPEKQPEQSVPQSSNKGPSIVQQPAKETMLEFKSPKKKQSESKPEQSVPQPSNDRPTIVPQPSNDSPSIVQQPAKPPKKKEPQKQTEKQSDKPAQKQETKKPEQNK